MITLKNVMSDDKVAFLRTLPGGDRAYVYYLQLLNFDVTDGVIETIGDPILYLKKVLRVSPKKTRAFHRSINQLINVGLVSIVPNAEQKSNRCILNHFNKYS